MALTVLSVAYPFAPVGRDAVGGAEQVLAAIDGALVDAGHRSIVVGARGSATRGELVATEAPHGPLDDATSARVRAAHARAVARAVERHRPDVVHLHGVDFDAYLPPPGPPTLVTLHLPPTYYRAGALRPARPRTYLHAVSNTQRAAFPPDVELLPTIPNGVDVASFRVARKRRYALALGRICPEKGFHLALDAAKRAGVPLVVGGAVFDYEAHRRHYEDDIAPRLDAARRFLGPLAFSRKRRLLSAARCLLAPSLVQETSSLVTMEALASGTPVIAFRSGALAEIVEDGVTGFLVRDVDEMARAIGRAGEIDPRACR
ncbi:MAG TPA: glycosyltransferase, partial [Minicystis sp.]|nr:glycosyltransferase [Minicystis sp.]